MSKRVTTTISDEMFAALEREAKLLKMSLSQYIRHSLQEHLHPTTTVYLGLKKVNLNEPIVYMTPQEERLADRAMKIHLEEDR